MTQNLAANARPANGSPFTDLELKPQLRSPDCQNEFGIGDDVNKDIKSRFISSTSTHFIITPLESPGREHHFRTPLFLRKKGLGEKPFDVFKSEGSEEVDSNSYYVHQPYVSFHCPPRTLRHGATKSSTPICIIKNSWFWRSWTLQFGNRLEEAIDPRGVVSWAYNTPEKAPTIPEEFAVKGYKVRKWRLCGETGKAYHHEVNKMRKEQTLEAGHDREKSATNNLTGGSIIDEVVHFRWISPFTSKTRQYQFQYHGIDFYWKGTGTVRESKTCGFMLKFNHLKLMASIPSGVDGEKDQDSSIHGPRCTQICLGKYTSQLGRRKAGILELYDAAIKRFLHDPAIPPHRTAETEAGPDVASVKHTRLYDIIIATAMCMVIGEWQKRRTIKEIIMTIAGEGAGGAGGG
ncbi:hypothetical protein EJ08DRAFT_703880 [Tothia fuscella]|uniref:Uncharacterized protein n=1 Tax=Tothia fuscella TaxID=1048955 RepID=A0A9P4NDI3_9PEZI|nr:hypothetical protein EJ08DRAFT_703880 [Tothia fuscella]